jgi:hypothetical protein
VIKVEHRYLWGLAIEYVARLKSVGLSGNINTSFVERIDLTIRRCVSKLARRTWSPAQFTSELAEHLYWWLAYYHFMREHESLLEKLETPIQRKGGQRPKQYRKTSPAAAAGLVARGWTILQMISYTLP